VYYFETNALFSLSKYFKFNKQIASEIYISFHCLFELLSGMDNENYDIRRKIILNIAEEKLVVATSTPQEIIASSFNVIDLTTHKLRDNVQKILEIVTVSDTLENAKAKIREIKSSTTFESLKADDDIVSSRDEAFANRKRFNNEINRKMKNQIRDEYREISDSPAEIKYKQPKEHYIQKLAEMFAKRVGPWYLLKKWKIHKIIKSYNGLCDYYLYGKSYLETEMLINGREIGKNDNMDISHLLYLDGNIMVTNDHLLQNILKIIDYKKVLTVDEFCKVVSWNDK